MYRRRYGLGRYEPYSNRRGLLCNGKAKEIPAEISVKYSFKARYKGYMRNDHCEHFVEVGEMISALSDGTLVCIDCTEEFL